MNKRQNNPDWCIFGQFAMYLQGVTLYLYDNRTYHTCNLKSLPHQTNPRVLSVGHNEKQGHFLFTELHDVTCTFKSHNEQLTGQLGIVQCTICKT